MRYKEAGGLFSVVRLEKEGGAGVFLPGVDYVDGKFILTQNTQNGDSVTTQKI